MPVLTRSQHKNIANVMKKKFVSNTNNLIKMCDSAQGKENKMRIALLVYQNINRDLPGLIEKNPVMWINFVATVFNKTTEFLDDAKQGNWINLDKSLVEEFKTEIHKSREFTASFVKANSVVSPKQHICVFRAIEEIMRPRRS
jgi:hypothetical protein